MNKGMCLCIEQDDTLDIFKKRAVGVACFFGSLIKS